jgi:opacity protein-like surface antigen
MKLKVIAAAAALALASVASAQEISSSVQASNAPGTLGLPSLGAPAPSPRPSAATSTLSGSVSFGPATTLSSHFAPLPWSEASANPEPQIPGRGNEDYSPWQLGLGYEFVRFNSSPFNANLNGLRTSLIYFPMESIGIEGNVVAAFGTKVFSNETSRYLLYTMGPRIRWVRPKWQPWMHVLVGGIHMVPQVADQGKTGFAVQAGGGAEYRLSPDFGVQVEGDYVRSQLYSEGQNNFQFGAGFVVHF